jgi:galactokinase
MSTNSGRTASLHARFRDRFGDTDDPRTVEAPGRINLIGEHTDYNDGWVLPMAIDRYVRIAFARRADRTLRAYSTVFEETCEIGLDDLESARGERWFAYLAGTAWAIARAGHDLDGIDLLVEGDLALGSGLSSSGALEMATARALCEAAAISWHPREMALLGRVAENYFVGVNCGPMDQLASAASRAGCALLLDCRTLETEAIRLPANARVIVMDTGFPRSLAESAYNDRRASCDRAVEAVRRFRPEVSALRDVDGDLLGAARDQMDDTTHRRAVHVVEENLRPRALASALEKGDLPLAGRLMNDSHASLRDLYEVSSRELDLVTDLARRHPACFGARLTGAGFGGCAVALVEESDADAFVEEVRADYAARVEVAGPFIACTPVAGVHLLRAATDNEARSKVHSEE